MMDFIEVLQSIRNGRSVAELAEKLGEMVEHTQQTGKESTLTYTLKVKPGGDGQIIVADIVGVKLPDANRASTIFFHDENYKLSRRDPRQLSLSELRDPTERGSR